MGNPLSEQTKSIVSLLAPSLSRELISALSDELARHGLKIQTKRRLSTSDEAEPGETACLEFDVVGSMDLAELRERLRVWARQQSVDALARPAVPRRVAAKLACFDMDSTLIQGEVIDELARMQGLYDRVAAVTERAMRGELDFKASLRERVALLAGLPDTRLREIIAHLPLSPGVAKLFTGLRTMGCRTAILSGGFTFFAEYLQQQLGIDHVYANRLEVVNGRLTGNVLGEIVDAQRKEQLLRVLAEQYGAGLDEVVAVGDGANDLLMLASAGTGIAFRAKPVVEQRASYALSAANLDGVLYLTGNTYGQPGSENS